MQILFRHNFDLDFEFQDIYEIYIYTRMALYENRSNFPNNLEYGITVLVR